MGNIRDNLGLTYGIYNHFDARKYPGVFRIAVETKNQNANQALSETLKEIKNLQGKGVSPTELSEAKAYLTGSFDLRMDSNVRMVRLLSAMGMYGLGLDFPGKCPDFINRVTAEEVLRVARTCLRAKNFYWPWLGMKRKSS